MPAKRGNVGGLLGKYENRLRQAHEEHKNDQTEYGNFSNLPPGIDNGVAQLEDCEFQVIKEGKKNAGEYQFYASGIVLEPVEHTYEDPPKSKHMRKVKTEGLRTFIVEPLCDTPDKNSRKTVEEHLAWIYNEFRKLGYDTANMEIDDLEAAAEALRESKPLFKFRTWRGEPTEQYPNPLTNHQWMGLVEDDYVPPDASQDVDNTVPPSPAPAPAPSRNGATATARPTSNRTQTTSQEPAADLEFGDIDSLVKMAKGNDKDKAVLAAREQLTQAAIDAGATLQWVDEEASDWDEVGDFIKSGSLTEEDEETEEGDEDEGDEEEETNEEETEEAEEEEEAEEPPTPKKGEVWKVRLLDPKTKKKSTRFTQVLIETVNKNGTAKVKSLLDKEVHDNIKLDDLVPAD